MERKRLGIPGECMDDQSWMTTVGVKGHTPMSSVVPAAVGSI